MHLREKSLGGVYAKAIAFVRWVADIFGCVLFPSAIGKKHFAHANES
ncbi:hypothetical protein [Trichocoleus sp. DQ-A2]